MIESTAVDGRHLMSAEREERNRPFIDEDAYSRLELNLLFFWSKYPNAKFTPGIIASAVGCGRRADLQQALEKLVKSGLVERYIEMGLSFYSLTVDRSGQEYVVNLASHANRLRRTLPIDQAQNDLTASLLTLFPHANRNTGSLSISIGGDRAHFDGGDRHLDCKSTCLKVVDSTCSVPRGHGLSE
jgi:hypothetical protein